MRKRHRLLFLFILLGIMPAPGVAQTPSKPAAPPRTAPTPSISGRVTLNGKPVPNQMVRVANNSFFGNLKNATTDAEGRFTIRGLFVGDFDLIVGFNGVRENSETVIGGVQSVRVAFGETVKDIEIRLRPGGTITGRITDNKERPVATRRLTLFRLPKIAGTDLKQWDDFSEGYFGFRSKTIQTDAMGVYRISGLPPGRYIVGIGDFLLPGDGGLVPREGNEPSPTFYPNAADPRQATVIELGPGEVAESRDIRTGAPVKSFTIAGQVVDDATGAPVPDMTIGVIYRTRKFKGGTFDEKSNANGEFRMSGIRAGNYEVQVLSSRVDNEYFTEPVPVTIRDGDMTLTIRLRRGVSATGRLRIFGKGDSFPFAQYSLSLVSRHPSPLRTKSAILNADGTFVILGIPPGNYSVALQPVRTVREPFQTIEIRQGDNDKTATGITVGTEPVKDILITAGLRSGLAYGQLQFNGDQPPPGSSFRVILQSEGLPLKVVQHDQVDNNFRFLIKDLLPGTYSIKVSTRLPSSPDSTWMDVTPATVTVTETGETLVNLTVVLANPSGQKPQ